MRWEGGRHREKVAGGWVGGYNQYTLCTCMKLSKNKKNHLKSSYASQTIFRLNIERYI